MLIQIQPVLSEYKYLLWTGAGNFIKVAKNKKQSSIIILKTMTWKLRLMETSRALLMRMYTTIHLYILLKST